VRDLAVFAALSFALAALVDVWFLHARGSCADPLTLSLLALAWGLLRMYTPAAGALLALKVSGRSVARELRSYLGLGRRALAYFLLAPLLAYLAVGVYALLGLALGLVDLSKPVRMTLEQLARLGLEVPEESVRLLLLAQLPLAYAAAVTVNALAALGEELGWRGYMFRRLGSRPDLKSTLAIGVVWGLWHATAIGLLGHNYPVLRWAGVPLFTAFCVLLTALMLPLVDRAGSVLPAASLHGAVNALWGYTILVSKVEGVAGEVLGGMGVLGLASLAAAWPALRTALSKLATENRGG
jgi:membrane protease YdiL (CAAX protease family)